MLPAPVDAISSGVFSSRTIRRSGSAEISVLATHSSATPSSAGTPSRRKAASETEVERPSSLPVLYISERLAVFMPIPTASLMFKEEEIPASLSSCAVFVLFAAMPPTTLFAPVSAPVFNVLSRLASAL